MTENWKRNSKVSNLKPHGCTIWKDLCFVDLNKEKPETCTKPSKDLIKTVKFLSSLKIVNLQQSSWLFCSSQERKSKILKTSLKNYLKIGTFYRSLNFFKALSKCTKNFQPGKIRSEKSFLERSLERTITKHVWCFALIILIFISDTKRIYSNIMKIEIYEVRNILHHLH